MGFDAYEQLAVDPGAVGDVARSILETPSQPGESYADTQYRSAQQAGATARIQAIKGKQWAARGVPSYQDMQGNTKPVVDDTGSPLNKLDPRHNIAYDSTGSPKKIDFDVAGGSPVLKDPFEGLDTTTDPKTGHQYKIAPGLPWRWVGTDAQTAQKAEFARQDADLSKASAALGRKLTLTEYDEKFHRDAIKDVRSQLKQLSVADTDPVTGDPLDYDGLVAGINSHYDDLKKNDTTANAKEYFGMGGYKPEALKAQADLDLQRTAALRAAAKGHAHAQTLDGIQQQAEAVRAQRMMIEQTKLDHETEILKAQGIDISQPRQPQAGQSVPQGMIQQGNIDLNTRPVVQNQDGTVSTVRSIGINVNGREVLIPTVSEDGRVMSNAEAVDTFKKTGRHLGVFGSEQDATRYAKQLHEQQAGQLDPSGQVQPQLEAEQPAAIEQATAPADKGSDYAGMAKAAAVGYGKGAAFLAAAPAGAALGAEIGALGGPLAFITVPAGGLIGGLISGVLGSMAAGKAINTLAKYSDTVKSFEQAEAEHPIAATVGNLGSFAAGIPKALMSRAGAAIEGENAIKTVGEKIGENAAAAKVAGAPAAATVDRAAALKEMLAPQNMRQAIANAYKSAGGGVVSTIKNFAEEAAIRATAGESTASIAAVIGYRVGGASLGMLAIDTAIKEGSVALGFSDEGQTLGGAGQALLIGAFVSGHGLRFPETQAPELTGILTRAYVRTKAGVGLADPLPPDKIPPGFDMHDAAAVAQPLTPREMIMVGAFEDQVRMLVNTGKVGTPKTLEDMIALAKGATGKEVELHGKRIATAVEIKPGEPGEAAPPTTSGPGLGGPEAPTPAAPGGERNITPTPEATPPADSIPPERMVSRTRMWRMARARLKEINDKANPPPVMLGTNPDGTPKMVQVDQPEYLSEAERAERDNLKEHLDSDNIEGIAKEYGYGLKEPVIQGKPAPAAEPGETNIGEKLGSELDKVEVTPEPPALTELAPEPAAKVSPEIPSDLDQRIAPIAIDIQQRLFDAHEELRRAETKGSSDEIITEKRAALEAMRQESEQRLGSRTPGLGRSRVRSLLESGTHEWEDGKGLREKSQAPKDQGAAPDQRQQLLDERNRLVIQELPKHKEGTNGHARVLARIGELDKQIKAQPQPEILHDGENLLPGKNEPAKLPDSKLNDQGKPDGAKPAGGASEVAKTEEAKPGGEPAGQAGGKPDAETVTRHRALATEVQRQLREVHGVELVAATGSRRARIVGKGEAGGAGMMAVREGGKIEILVSPEDLLESLANVEEKNRDAFLEKVIQEEVIHTQTLAAANERDASGNLTERAKRFREGLAKLPTTEKGIVEGNKEKGIVGLREQRKKTWDKMSEIDKGHEIFRVIMQGRDNPDTQPTTESTWDTLKAFVEWLKAHVKNLSASTKKLLSDLEAWMAKRKQDVAEQPESPPKNPSFNDAAKEAFDGLFAEAPASDRLARFRAENEAFRKAKAERIAKILSDAGAEGGVKLEPENIEKLSYGVQLRKIYLTVTPDNLGYGNEAGSWRVTQWDELGPFSHNPFVSREAALRAVGGESHTKLVPGPPYFAHGPYKVVRVTKKEGNILHAEAPRLEQKPIPEGKDAAFLTLATTALKDGATTPEALGKMLVDFNPAARAYSQAVWSMMAARKPELAGSPDWNMIYKGKDSEFEVPTYTVAHRAPGSVPFTEQEMSPKDIHLSEDVPNIKEKADPVTGVVPGQELSGEYDRGGGGNRIVVWQRTNGRNEVITGRHRRHLAIQNDVKAVPVQVFKESDGFTKDMAVQLDAESNIRDGQGDVSDYANYFRHSKITSDEASSRGLLARHKGRAGYAIGKNASDDLYALYRAEKIGDAKAAAIATTAPGDQALQQIGIKYALKGESAAYIVNVMKAATAGAQEKGTQIDLFGNDDSAMVEMERRADTATKMQQAVRDRINAVRGAVKRPEAAAEMGVDVKDVEGTKKEIARLEEESARWDNWPMHPDLVAKVKGEEAKPEKKAEPKKDEAEVSDDEYFGNILRTAADKPNELRVPDVDRVMSAVKPEEVEKFRAWLLDQGPFKQQGVVTEITTWTAEESPVTEYAYGMRNRPRQIGAQPKDFARVDENDKRGRHGVIFYNRKLTADEIYSFELEELGEQDKKPELKQDKVEPPKIPKAGAEYAKKFGVVITPQVHGIYDQWQAFRVHAAGKPDITEVTTTTTLKDLESAIRIVAEKAGYAGDNGNGRFVVKGTAMDWVEGQRAKQQREIDGEQEPLPDIVLEFEAGAKVRVKGDDSHEFDGVVTAPGPFKRGEPQKFFVKSYMGEFVYRADQLTAQEPAAPEAKPLAAEAEARAQVLKDRLKKKFKGLEAAKPKNRLQQLHTAAQERALTLDEQAERDTLERAEGQGFMDFAAPITPGEVAAKKEADIKAKAKAAIEFRLNRKLVGGNIETQTDAFGPQEGETMSLFAEAPHPFYSALTKTVESIPQLQMTVQQARAAIEKGAKKDEIAMSGIFTDPLSPLFRINRLLEGATLKGKPITDSTARPDSDKVTKAELISYALERQATVQDVVLGKPVTPAEQEQYQQMNDKVAEINTAITEATDGEITVRDLVSGSRHPTELNDKARDLWNERGDLLSRRQDMMEEAQKSAPTHFGRYQLPGADEGSYREMFVTWPETEPEKPRHVTFAEVEKKDPALARDLDEELYAYASRTMTDRERDIETNNALYDNRNISEELAARLKAAFPDYEKQVERFHATLGKNWRDGHPEYSDIANPWARMRVNMRTVPLESIRESMLELYESIKAQGRTTVKIAFLEEAQLPSPLEQAKAPKELFKGGRGYEVAMKRFLRWAVDEGADAIAWTTGEQQVERYPGVEKQVESIRWGSVLGGSPSHNEGQVKWLIITPKEGGQIDLSLDSNGTVVEARGGKAERLLKKNIAEVIGKDVAQRIVDEEKGDLAGEGLKVGGEGLKRLYDVMLPAIANDLAKKFGVKVGRAEIEDVENLKKYVQNYTAWLEYVDPDGLTSRDEFYAMTEAEKIAAVPRDELFTTSVHSLPIPDALKTQQRTQGSALFAEAPTAGATDRQQKLAAAAWKAKGVESSYFKKWQGKAELYRIGDDLISAENGKPVVVEGFHGTTHDFAVVDPSKANVENDMGQGFYVTNTPEDVQENYAGEGPDLTSRIEREADYISNINDPEDLVDRYGIDENEARSVIDNPTDEARRNLARKILTQHGGATMKVFVKLENPLKLGENEPYWDSEWPADENGDPVGEPTGKMIDFLQAIRNESRRDVDLSALDDVAMDGMKAGKAIAEAKKALGDSEDDNGDLNGNEIIRTAIERMGYDGILDGTVDEKFGYKKGLGKPMKGVGPSTVHVIAFWPEQVKSATGNRGTFTKGSRSMLEAATPEKQKQLEFAGEMFTDAVQLGAHYIQTGSHRFTEWAEKMREDCGPKIEKYLKSIYETAKVTIESPRGESVEGRPPGLERGLRPPTERIVTARAEHTQHADESVIPDELKPHLDEHQRQGAAAGIASMEKIGGFLNADGTGAGKTRQALTVASHFAKQGKRVVIVTKAETIKQDWAKNTFGGSYGFDSKAMGIPLDLVRDGNVKPGKIGITTYQNLSDVDRNSGPDTVLIFDEAHALKNDSQQAKYGMSATQKASKVMFMSATPADKAEHIYYLAGIGIMEGKTVQKALEDLGMKLVTVKKRDKNGRQYEVKFWAPDGRVSDTARNARFSALFNRMTAKGAMIKREISMDGVHVNMLRVSLPPEGHDVQQDILRHFDATHIDDLQGLKRAIVLGHMRRQQEPFKIASTVMLAQREMEQGRQVVIFVSRVNASEVGKWVKGLDGERYRDILMSSEGTAKTLAEAMRDAGIHDIAEIHGNADQNSLEAMADFQSGKKRVVIATIESGGTGINLDDILGNRPRSMIIVTAPFDAVGNVQAAGRIWRLKTMSGANLFYLFGNTDVDEWNKDIIGSKMAMLGAVVEGQVRKLDVSDPEQVSLDDFHSSVAPVSNEGSPRGEMPEGNAFPTLDWKPFKTKAGKDKFVADATPEFWKWWKANGERNNSEGVSLNKRDGKWQVWSDREIGSTELSAAAPERKATDAAYMDAVNRGDMETAQRMVDEAAKAAGAHTNTDGSVQHFIRGGNERGKTVFPGASFWTLDTEAGRKVAEGYRDSAGDFLGRKIPDAERKVKNADIFRMYRELPEPLKKGHALAAAMHAHGRGSDVSRYYNESAEQTFERTRQLVIKMAKEERWPHPEITQALKDRDWDRVLELSEPHVYLAFEANPIGMTNGEVRDQLTSREQKHRYDALTSRANYFAPFKSITRAYLMFKNPLRLNGTGAITPQSVEQARKDGYDAIWSEGAVGGDTLGRDNRIPEVVVLSAEQVKSSEPSEVPLSERFNPDSDSILHAAAPERKAADAVAAGAKGREETKDDRKAAQAATFATKPPGVASQIWDAVKTAGSATKRWWGEMPAYDTIDKAIGQWLGAGDSAPLKGTDIVIPGRQKAAHESRKLVETIVKQFPNVLTRQAISRYMEADGDKTTLQKWADKSKPEMKTVYERALNLNAAEKAMADTAKTFFKEKGEEAQKLGLLGNLLENYVTHFVEKAPANQRSGLMARILGDLASDTPASKLKTKFDHAIKRVFSSMFDLEQEGHSLRGGGDIAGTLAAYAQAANNTVADRVFVKSLTDIMARDGRPMAVPSGAVTLVEDKPMVDKDGNPVLYKQGDRKGEQKTQEGALFIKPHTHPADTSDYRPIAHPALRKWKWLGKDSGDTDVLVEGELLIHPDLYKRLKNTLGTSALNNVPIIKAVGEFQAIVKQLMLSFSPFHFVQEGTHAIGHKVNPFKVAEIDMEDPATRELVNAGLMLANWNAKAEFGEGLTANGMEKLLSHIGLGKLGKLNDTMSAFLFEKYIPGLKIAMAKEAMVRNMERFKKELASGKMTREQVAQKTAQQANDAFGEQNNLYAGNNPTRLHAERLLFLAPDFLKSRAKFFADAFRKHGNEQRNALILLAVVLAVTAKLLERMLTGKNDWEKPFSVVTDDREYELRSVPGDVIAMLKNTRQFVMGRISPLISRTALEAATGRDWRGQQRSAGQQVKDLAMVPLPLALRGVIDPEAPDISTAESLISSSGLRTIRHSEITKARKLGREWQKANGSEHVDEVHPPSKYVGIKNALEDGDSARAMKEYGKLLATMPKDKADTGFRSSLMKPFSGSLANEKAFVASLDADDRATYQAAMTKRGRMLAAFTRMSATTRAPANAPRAAAKAAPTRSRALTAKEFFR